MAQQDDIYIFSPTVTPQYLIRHPSLKWWYTMEDFFEEVPMGTRLLIRRDIRFNQAQGGYIVNDYITTRVARETFYGHWVHYYVTYREGEDAPYGYDINAYESRHEILSENYNNNPDAHMKWMDLTPAIRDDAMEEDRGSAFPLTMTDLPDSLPLPFPASFPPLSNSIPSSAWLVSDSNLPLG
jgi:hypothetical protein